MEKTAYAGWPNCLRLSNKDIECVVTTDVGPRIIRLGFKGSQNLFAELEGRGETKGPVWKSYGGHRLWHAPEHPVRTYYPDNDPVPYEWKDGTLLLRPSIETTTGIAKEIEIFLDPERNRIRVTHRLRNDGLWPVTLSVWCLSVMAKGGFAVIPQEDYRGHGPDALLPVRSMALWSYSDMGDPRWTWGSDYILLRQDPAARTPLKAGWLNRKGWAAYALGGEVFLKRFAFDPGAVYPDFNTNTQFFTNAEILEVETLSPLIRLEPDRSIDHVEEWSLHRVKLEPDQASLRKVLPGLTD
jgi:hypothetical protein